MTDMPPTTLNLKWIGPAVGCVSLVVAAWSLIYAAQFTIPRTHESRPAQLAADMRQYYQSYRRNKRVLDRFRAIVEREYNRTGRYPQSRDHNFRDISIFFEDYPDLGRLAEFKLSGRGDMIYKSDGQNYKLLLYNTGDCFVAHALNPELRDMTRSAGFQDCVQYGYWSSLGSIL